jgi:subtilisin family serine protease
MSSTITDPNSLAQLRTQVDTLETADAAKQPLTGNTFAVAGLPAAASNVGRVVYVTNGSAGNPCAAVSDGTNWKVLAIGATVSAT